MTDDGEAGLDRYLIEIRSESQIPQNEDALIESARAGDQAAKRELAKSYLALTAEIGLRARPPGMPRLTAVQEANLVLLRLIESGTKKPAVELGRAIEEHFASLG